MKHARQSTKVLLNLSHSFKENIFSQIFCAEPEVWQTIEIGDNWVIRIHILPGRKPAKIQVS